MLHKLTWKIVILTWGINMAYDMVIKGAKAVTPDGVIEADIVVQNGVIAEIGSDIEASGTEIIQADGKYVFPGVIDCHVHFNEPGRRIGRV